MTTTAHGCSVGLERVTVTVMMSAWENLSVVQITVKERSIIRGMTVVVSLCGFLIWRNLENPTTDNKSNC